MSRNPAACVECAAVRDDDERRHCDYGDDDDE